MKKNILIISIYYPPIQSIASNRIYSFAKYLDRDKYNIFVHTLDDRKSFHNDLKDVFVSRSTNNALFKPLTFSKRTNKIVHYSKVCYNIMVKRFTKNIYQSWINESFKLLKLRVKEENIDLILSSFSPDASHLLALKLKKEFPHLKWIADMRDEMSCSPYIDTVTKSHYEKLEQQIFKYANALTSVSKPIVDEFQSICQEKNFLFAEIRNGYDFPLEKKETMNDTLVLTYMGNFYGDINPNNFFKAMKLFMGKHSDAKVKVQLVGVKTHFKIPSLLRDMIEIIPSVDHESAVELMRQSDALLLVHPSNGRKGVFTGKLFEYLGVLKPIIALVDEEDVAAKLIRECNAGYVSDNSNIGKIEANIALIYDEYIQKKERIFNVALIQKHHRKQQVQRLAVLIEEYLNG